MEKTVLIIAGSDSCAGAGIEIDIKCAAAHGVHATVAITAITAQNTYEVTAIQPIDASVVKAQIEAVCADMPPAAIKIGMLGNADVAIAVAEALERHEGVPVVLDPVLVATAGATLSESSVLDVMHDRLIPRAAIVTPNIPEAVELTGIDVCDSDSAHAAAQALLDEGAASVLVKGGHDDAEILADRLYFADEEYEFLAARLPGDYHGTGCSLSTAIACNIACGKSLVESVRDAHDFIARALLYPLDIGHGAHVLDPLNASPVWERAIH